MCLYAAPSTFLSWLDSYGAERIILGADAANKKVAINGWQEQSELELTSFLQDYVSKGVRYAICTDIAKDGMLQGTSLELYQEIRSSIPSLLLIASGGVSSMSDVVRLAEMQCFGAIVGKAIYEGKITLSDIESYHAF
nr:hypothetical protein [Desulfobacula sp.]